ncbi:MAG TPA: SdrD B-like domain-containing protein, partial [Kofleriaceae bacterium]
MLFVWVIYPMVATMYRSLFNDRGTAFVWLDNYEQIFTDERLQTALKNNALWVLIVPAAVTAVGLVFAVLTERIVWATAFKISVFMPLAISLFAVGVIWRIMYQQDPDRGAINAGLAAIKGGFSDEGVLTQASPSTDDLTGSIEQGFELERTVQPGGVAELGLTAIRVPEIPEDAVQAVKPEPLQGGITGVVWRDFKPGGGTAGEVEPGELGLPGVTVELRDSEGDTIDDTTTETNGTFAFDKVADGEYHIA